MTLRNRIIEYRMVTPDEVSPNPRNWRVHPERQRRALRAILESIGVAGAVIAYYSARNDGKLTLIDGHERMTIGEPMPCLVLDVTDDEADALLATYDPISQWVDIDHQLIESLLADVGAQSSALKATLDDIAAMYGVFPDGVFIEPSPVLVSSPPNEDAPMFDAPFQTVKIYFLNAQARDEFARLIGRNITDKTKYLWYPENPGYRATSRNRAAALIQDGNDHESSRSTD